jgi:MFS family permease
MLAAAVRRYRAFLELPDVGRMVVMAFLSRLSIGTLSLAMLLHVRSLTGSFATAGATVGSYLAAMAVTAPIIGRWIDRRGPRSALRTTGVMCPLALTLILAAEPLSLAPHAIIAVAVLAGAFAPPVSVVTRTMWRYRLDDERDRSTAFAIDGVLIELAFTLGPMIVAALIALATPTAAFAAAWFFCAASVPLFFASPALKYWHHQPDMPRHLFGPLTEPRLLVVYAAAFLFTFCLGLTEVGYPGFAIAAGSPALSGVLLAVWSIGSAAGGLAYGAMHLRMPGERQLTWLLALMALPLALQAAVDSAFVLGTLALIAGLMIAPIFTVFSMLVANKSPQRYATEAFTWLSTCIVSGVGSANAIGGILIERSGAPSVFALSAGTALAAAVVVVKATQRPRKSP